MRPPRVIVVGIDFSAGCYWALRESSRMAAEGDYLPHMVHAVTFEVMTAWQKQEAIGILEMRARIRSRIEHFVLNDLEPGAAFESVVLIGSPLEELLRYAEDSSAEFLLLGSEGWGRRGSTGGRIASGCRENSRVPVKIVEQASRAALRSHAPPRATSPNPGP